jgi:site-specific DNA-methyltransferase (adenine-specific)
MQPRSQPATPPAPAPQTAPPPEPWFRSRDGAFVLYRGDSLETLSRLGLESKASLVFADPPYFLSNGGITCRSGRMASVDKGAWDRLQTVEGMHSFNTQWLTLSRALLSEDGSIWVSGTRHVIYSVGFAMQQIGFRLLNEITWQKPNPPPNLSCRYFTHATETILWASKSARSRHTFHYKAMKLENGGKQMKSVWTLSSPAKSEKRLGKHPTQKPLALLERIVLASSKKGELVVDPFAGSGTTGLAAVKHRRRFVGIELDEKYLELAAARHRAEFGS